MLRRTDGEYLQEGTALLIRNGKEHEVSMTVQESASYLKLAESLSQFTDLQNGIAVSKKTADRFGIKKGDTVAWKAAGQDKKICSKVQAVIRTPVSQGITMMRRDYLDSGLKFRPTAVIGKIPENGFGNYEGQCTISLQADLTNQDCDDPAERVGMRGRNSPGTAGWIWNALLSALHRSGIYGYPGLYPMDFMAVWRRRNLDPLMDDQPHCIQKNSLHQHGGGIKGKRIKSVI